jgi:hypothetical protein
MTFIDMVHGFAGMKKTWDEETPKNHLRGKGL